MPGVARFLILVLLVGPSMAAADRADVRGGAQAELLPTPRAAILIDGDSAFTEANGVRRGSGTAADPYVVSGWLLMHDRLSALALRNTRAHVLVDEIYVPRQSAQPATECDLASLTCPIFTGIELTNVTNVSVRASRLAYEEVGIFVRASADVHIEAVVIGDGALGGVAVTGWGILVQDSERVTIRGLQTLGARYAFEIQGAREVVVERSLFNGSTVLAQGVSLLAPLDGVRLSENRFDRVRVLTVGRLSNLSVLRNEFEGGFAGFGNGAFGFYRDASFCGNTFVGGGTAIVGGDATNLRIAGNWIVDNDQGVKLGPAENLTLERNLIRGSRSEGAWLSGVGLAIRDNAFVANGRGVFLPTHGTDASGNWWGHSSGPAGVGPGSGDELRTVAGRTVTYSPWLMSEPDISDPCQGAAAPLEPSTRGHTRVNVTGRLEIHLLGVVETYDDVGIGLASAPWP